MLSMIGRGGLVLAFGTRWMWMNISSSTSSGMPMCMNASSEKNRSLMLVG